LKKQRSGDRFERRPARRGAHWEFDLGSQKAAHGFSCDGERGSGKSPICLNPDREERGGYANKNSLTSSSGRNQEANGSGIREKSSRGQKSEKGH